LAYNSISMSSTSDLPDDLVERAGQLLSFHPPTSWCADARSELEKAQDETPEIGVACSGGADSVSALLLIFAAYPKLRKRIWVLHFNHRLRQEASDLDESFVRSIASKLDLAFISEKSQGYQKIDEGSLRDQRLNFFEKITLKEELKFIVQGHHLNDVAESLLWRIPRGVSVDGLISPKPVSQVRAIRFMRPLLTLTKPSILDGMRKCNIPWREDDSNSGTHYLRNRIRQTVLPVWEKAGDRDLLKGVSMTAQILREESHALNYHAEEAFQLCLDHTQSLEIQRLNQLPAATQIRVLRKWLGSLHADFNDDISLSSKAELVKAFLLSDARSLRMGNNCLVKRSDRVLSFEIIKSAQLIPFSALPLYGEICFPSKFSSTAREIPLTERLLKEITQGHVNQAKEAYISATEVSAGVFLRSRTRGDQFHPLGAPGGKNLSDRMIDQKWSQQKKDETPVFINNDEKVLWVPGFPPAEFAKVKDGDLRVIHLTYNNLCTSFIVSG
jgi:tRNA(Ile)-lysidine synthase